MTVCAIFFFFSSRRRHTRWPRDWSSDVCSSDLVKARVREHPLERSFELSNIGADVLGDKERNLFVDLDTGGRSLREQDRDAHLELGRLESHGEPQPKREI